MAARGGGTSGWGITTAILGVVCLTLFILTIVYVSKAQRAQRDLAQFNADTVETLAQRLEAVPGASTNSLLGILRDRDAEIVRLQTERDQADAARQTANQDLANESARTQQLIKSHEETVARLNKDIDQYKAEVDSYRQGTNDFKAEADRRVEQIRQDLEARLAQTNQTVSALETEKLVLQEQVGKLRRERKSDILKPAEEFSLIDGEVIGVNPGQNEVFIGRGRRDKIVLGMAFTVYGERGAIRADPNTGDYPPGKATIEVINVGEDSSTARITSEIRGNPIVKGDVIANAVYDPAKTYKFMVYGNFDSNRDGVSTAGEAEDVRALIAAWGGQAVDDLVGDVDFLVLGQRPQLPPAPNSGTPLPVVNEWMRLNDIAVRYDKLLEQAVATSVPILNQNRLYTLTGHRVR